MKLSEYFYREAIQDDILRMKYIRDHVKENALVSSKIEVEDYKKALFTDGKGWVCVFNNEVIGFSCGRLSQKDVWALFIDQRHEGNGVGNHLMKILEDWMFSNVCDEIKLSTTPQTRAEKLYRKRGRLDMGILPNKEIQFRLKKMNE